MAQLRGQRVTLDLDSDDDGNNHDNVSPANHGTDMVKDISERPVSSAAPAPPRARNTANGFPAHRSRIGLSKFKQMHAPEQASVPPPPSSQPYGGNPELTERQAIDLENRRRIADMSDAEYEGERQELFATLSPSLVQRLLRRGNIDEQTPTWDPSAGDNPTTRKAEEPSRQATVAADTGKTQNSSDEPPIQLASPAPSVPLIVNPAEPDPFDPDFLETLHEKYFPDLPVDPSKLSWMQDAPQNDKESPYSPQQSSVSINQLRFSFTGALLAPKTAHAIPVTKGLHHHGDAPAAAGYTVPELAHLARSAFPSQRCIAYQTLGRLMYRLGAGQYGTDADDMYLGLWKCLEQGRVLDTLQEEAARKDGHLSAKAYATEALWLWQQGGGKRLRAS